MSVFFDSIFQPEYSPPSEKKVHFAEEPKLHIYEPDQAAESITSDKVEAILADEKPQEDFCKKQSKRVSFVEKHVVHHYESEDQNVESSADQEYPDSSSQKAWETQENETSQSSIALNDWLDYELDQQVHFQTTERELEALENLIGLPQSVPVVLAAAQKLCKRIRKTKAG
uniref:Uncharacterized protein n=1 Tax=Ditylenchus dipsaci TaxID=166011 RepID=A0A915EN13_9BILA